MSLYIATMSCYMTTRFIADADDHDGDTPEKMKPLIEEYVRAYMSEPRVMAPTVLITVFTYGTIWKTLAGWWDLDAGAIRWDPEWTILDERWLGASSIPDEGPRS